MPAMKPFAVLPLALSNITSGNAKANRPASHLALPQFTGMRWESSGSASLWVRGQFTGTQAVDFVSLMAANAQPGTTIRVRLGTSQAEVDGTAPYDSGAVTFISPARTEASNLYHSHLELPSVQNASWWRIDIGGHFGDFSASALVFGRKQQAAFFYNHDREFGFEDLGGLEIARNGVVGDTPGSVLRTLLFRLQWVSEEEWFTNWEPLGLRNGDGSKRLIYWCFDSDATVRRQAKSYLGYMARDPFLRGNDFPLWNQIDVQFRALDFGSVARSLVAELAARSATLAVYDWTSPGSMTAGGGGAVTPGAAIASIPNVKTPGTLDLGQSDSARRPTYTNGATFDGSNDFLAATFTANTGPTNATLVYALRTADTQFLLGGTNSLSFFAGIAESGAATSPNSIFGTPAFAANGGVIASATRASLFSAWGTNTPVVARLANVNFRDAAITGIQNSLGTSGFFLNGRACLVAILDAGDANYAGALALAEQEAARIITALSI